MLHPFTLQAFSAGWNENHVGFFCMRVHNLAQEDATRSTIEICHRRVRVDEYYRVTSSQPLTKCCEKRRELEIPNKGTLDFMYKWVYTNGEVCILVQWLFQKIVLFS